LTSLSSYEGLSVEPESMSQRLSSSDLVWVLPVFVTFVLGIVPTLNARAQETSGPDIRYQKGLPVPVAPQPELRAEACAPATALRDLEWNNVRALIENGGALWYDRAIDKGAHFVPKEDGVSVVYGGALWLGGISPDQQLKLAAVRYRNTGNDFWPGPLTNDG